MSLATLTMGKSTILWALKNEHLLDARKALGRTMSVSRAGPYTKSNLPPKTEVKSNRVSIAQTPTRSPSVISPRSPIPSIHNDIESTEFEVVEEEPEYDRRGSDTVFRASLTRTLSSIAGYSGGKEVYPETSGLDLPNIEFVPIQSPKAYTQILKSTRSSLNTPIFTAPTSSDVALGKVYPDSRYSLLNEPSSFLSVTTSPRSSTVSSRGESGIEEEAHEDLVMAAAQQARLNRPSTMKLDREGAPTNKNPNFSNLRTTRVKANRILGEDLRALATEQGSVSAGALASPTFSSPPRSAASRIPSSQHFLPVPAVVQVNEASNNENILQYPLGANPPPGREPLYRSATLPHNARRRNASFLPAPIDPNPGRRFERQSTVSTPYPHSGSMADKQRESPRENLRTNAVHTHAISKHATLPVIVRDARDLDTKLGKVEVQKSQTTTTEVSKTLKSELFDDSSLALSILQEYSRLKGWPRTIFNARGIASVKVHYKPLPVGAGIDEKEEPPHYPPIGPPPDFHPQGAPISALSAAEEGHGPLASLHPAGATARNSPATAVARRELESSLRALLQRPASGAIQTTCVSNLWSLLDAQRGSGVAIEILESWSEKKIVFAVIAAMVLSVLATLLWTLLG
ncbi:MAG: hypothetical protein LQ340_001172, partial [Diploschistes diacapsis]